MLYNQNKVYRQIVQYSVKCRLVQYCVCLTDNCLVKSVGAKTLFEMEFCGAHGPGSDACGVWCTEERANHCIKF